MLKESFSSLESQFFLCMEPRHSRRAAKLGHLFWLKRHDKLCHSYRYLHSYYQRSWIYDDDDSSSSSSSSSKSGKSRRRERGLEARAQDRVRHMGMMMMKKKSFTTPATARPAMYGRVVVLWLLYLSLFVYILLACHDEEKTYKDERGYNNPLLTNRNVFLLYMYCLLSLSFVGTGSLVIMFVPALIYRMKFRVIYVPLS